MPSPWSFPVETCSSPSVSTSEKTAQMGTSINNGLDNPSKLPALNALANAPLHSKMQVEMWSPTYTKSRQSWNAYP